jgi:thioredoxin-like negative regulator of GroEL
MSSYLEPTERPSSIVAETTQRAMPAAEAQAKPTLVFFYSPRSGSSRRVEGFLAQVLQRRRNHDTFILRRIDYEAHGDLAARLGVAQPPAIVVVEAKRVRARLERPRGCVDIKATLTPWLK